ncbi:hypothetical protein [Actinopolymorpha alba]|uniref:hypothetical protein n=1 Tax=Actinopolymorpha alba TaxID=533267 RepID=UPI0012F621C0|nr:hypothetical protein [Actinopolymorpha alba]
MSDQAVRLLRDALNYSDPDQTVRHIKSQVSKHLLLADPKTNVRHTEYFNHSFAPDMVLSWPAEHRERLVFIRSNADPRWMLEDLRWLTPNRPIIMTLEPSTDPEDSEVRDRLASAVREGDTLVTDLDGMDELSRSREPVVEILAHAVLRGGRGLLTESSAQAMSDVAVRGFERAQNLDVPATSNAVAAFSEALESTQSGRMTRVLQAVWEGHGGSAATFPGEQGLGGPLTAEDLMLLLDVVESDDVNFWRRIGRNISIDQLSGLVLDDPSENLQRLVRSNLDRLSGRAVRVLMEQDQLGEPSGVPRWRIDRSCLTLRGWGWSAYFSNSRDRLPAADEFIPPTVRQLQMRAQRDGLTVTNMQVRRPDLTITYESTTDESVLDSIDSNELVQRSDVLATRATVSARLGRGLICDFETCTAGGHTNASYDLSELGRFAIPLLLELREDQRDALREILAPLVEEAHQQALDFGD